MWQRFGYLKCIVLVYAKIDILSNYTFSNKLKKIKYMANQLLLIYIFELNVTCYFILMGI